MECTIVTEMVPDVILFVKQKDPLSENSPFEDHFSETVQTNEDKQSTALEDNFSKKGTKMIKFFIVLFLLVNICNCAQPTRVRCKDIENPENRHLCWLGFNIANESNDQTSNFLEAEKRNSELSSALNALYGDNSPGKRNPELSSALMSYLNEMRKYSK
ncbi:hypothetical protein JTB14_032682 [Gonioctena quinquepunctata]|nr:hypothetical protein JTB14_032682 [Gonioctena quinquepunctata]